MEALTNLSFQPYDLVLDGNKYQHSLSRHFFPIMNKRFRSSSLFQFSNCREARHVDHEIGINQAIRHKAAIAFAIGFYQALGAGRAVEEAYEMGCVQIRLQGISEHLTPVLIKKGQA